MTKKLVRDRVPEIIRADGREPVVTVADSAEFRSALRTKLNEEVGEYLGADDSWAVEELADVVEVVYALAETHGVTPEELEHTRRTKAERRGAFTGRLIWHGNREG